MLGLFRQAHKEAAVREIDSHTFSKIVEVALFCGAADLGKVVRDLLFIFIHLIIGGQRGLTLHPC